MKKRLSEVINIVRFLFISNKWRELFKKLYLRVTSPSRAEEFEASEWAASQASDFYSYLSLADKALQEATCLFIETEYSSSQKKSNSLLLKGVDLGGGAHVALLFFLVIRLKPKAVLETGVAAGHSSYAILKAMHLNGFGKLYSSDFPYFRLKNSTSYIGTVVPEELRNDWKLYLDGDASNLPKIFSHSKEKFRLVHYDSDKRRKSRENFIHIVRPHLDQVYVLIFDDIQDDLSFRDFVVGHRLDYLVFKWEGKFVGCIFSGLDKEVLFSEKILHIM